MAKNRVYKQWNKKIPFFDKQPSRPTPKTKQINGMGKQDRREWEEKIEMLIINLIWWLPTQNSIMNESYAAKISGISFSRLFLHIVNLAVYYQ